MSIFSAALLGRADALLSAARAANVTVVTAESCTGGLVAALLTEVAGSSSVFERGFVTYSNAAKHDLLGIPEALLARFGAVSAETAEAMASGALANARASLSVSITGIAGPGGGSGDKPVGLVYFGCGRTGGAVRTVRREFGDRGRSAVRMAAIEQALDLLESEIANHPAKTAAGP